MIEWQSLAIGILGILSGISGWLLRELWQAVKDLRRDLGALQVHVADQYVKGPDFDAAVNRILNAIDDIRKDLNRKEDRK